MTAGVQSHSDINCSDFQILKFKTLNSVTHYSEKCVIYVEKCGNSYCYIYMGAKGDWDFRIYDLVKNPDGTDI